jgi:hypothetical protein
MTSGHFRRWNLLMPFLLKNWRSIYSIIWIDMINTKLARLTGLFFIGF